MCFQGACQLAVASGAPDRKPFGWETGAPQTGCFDNIGIRESVPGGPPEPFVTIQLTIVDVLGVLGVTLDNLDGGIFLPIVCFA